MFLMASETHQAEKRKGKILNIRKKSHLITYNYRLKGKVEITNVKKQSL